MAEVTRMQKLLLGLAVGTILLSLLYVMYFSSERKAQRWVQPVITTKESVFRDSGSDLLNGQSSTILGDMYTLPGSNTTVSSTTTSSTTNTSSSTTTTSKASNATKSTTTSRSSKHISTKVIYQPSGNGDQTRAFNKYFKSNMKFESCEYNNCVYTYSHQFEHVAGADVIFVEYSSPVAGKVAQVTNPLQQWIAYSHEPPGFYPFKAIIDKFDGTMTYTRDSTFYWPWGEMMRSPSPTNSSKNINFAEGKSKGAYAYVSHCKSIGYNRIEIMKQLNKHIDVDIFGRCTDNIPCNRGDISCETTLHSKYRFFFAFENSLCKEYITEKFWKRLHSESYFIPVAVGGLSVEEYTDIAPPDSFIHAYNFSSIDQLGQYLRHLMDDDAAYNRYHQWRGEFQTTDNVLPQRSVCKLCEIANKPTLLKSSHHLFAKEWNNASNCRQLRETAE